MSERDAKIQDLEHSLADLERKSKEAVSAAQSLRTLRRSSRGEAPRNLRPSPPPTPRRRGMRLESSLSQAERGAVDGERDAAGASFARGTPRARRGHPAHRVWVGALEDRRVGLARGQLAGLVRMYGMTPGASSASAPMTVDALEMVAAQMWAQLESAGVDPSRGSEVRLTSYDTSLIVRLRCERMGTVRAHRLGSRGFAGDRIGPSAPPVMWALRRRLHCSGRSARGSSRALYSLRCLVTRKT